MTTTQTHRDFSAQVPELGGPPTTTTRDQNGRGRRQGSQLSSVVRADWLAARLIPLLASRGMTRLKRDRSTSGTWEWDAWAVTTYRLSNRLLSLNPPVSHSHYQLGQLHHSSNLYYSILRTAQKLSYNNNNNNNNNLFLLFLIFFPPSFLRGLKKNNNNNNNTMIYNNK